MEEMIIRNLPKVELHCHLDGSVSLETLQHLAEKEGRPVASLKEVIAPDKCLNLKDYLRSFDVILSLLQTKENLTLAAYDVIKQVARENVCYIEIRFAPLLHQDKGLTINQIISAVCEGISQGEEEFDIKANLLICGMRHHLQQDNMNLISEISSLSNKKIVGIDFAGDEQQFPNSKLTDCLKLAKDHHLQITLHSGECGCAQNVIEAIKLGAQRIGHGVAIKDDPLAIQYCVDQDILLEMCPTSNIQTNAIERWEDYPLTKFLDLGLKCCINTDNRTVSQTTLTNEYLLLNKHAQLTYEIMKQLNLNAINYSFANEQVKVDVREAINKGFSEL